MTARRVDFVRLIAQMRDAGLSLTDISRQCGCPVQTVSDIARDPRRKPSYTVGAAIVDLHRAIGAEPVPQGQPGADRGA